MGAANIIIISLLISILAAGSVYIRGMAFNNSDRVKKEVMKISIITMIIAFITMILILKSADINSSNNDIIDNTVTNKEEALNIKDESMNNELVDYEEILGTVSDIQYTERGLEIQLIDCKDKFIITDKTILSDGLVIKNGSDIKLKYEKTESYIKQVFSVKDTKLELLA